MNNYLARLSIICITLFFGVLMINAQKKVSTNRFLIASNVNSYRDCGDYFHGDFLLMQYKNNNKALIKCEYVSNGFGYLLLMSEKIFHEVRELTKLICVLNQEKSKDIFHEKVFKEIEGIKNSSYVYLFDLKPHYSAKTFTLFFESFVYMRSSSISYHHTFLSFSFLY